MKQLQLGRISSKELADWFGYAYSTYRKKKSLKYLVMKNYLIVNESAECQKQGV